MFPYEYNRTGSFLAGWKPLVYPDQLLSTVFQLVFKHEHKLTPAIVRYRFSKMAKPSHSLHVQIFNHDCIIRFGKIQGFLMEKVLSLVRDLFMESGNLLLLFQEVV